MGMVSILPRSPLTQRDLCIHHKTIKGTDICTWQGVLVGEYTDGRRGLITPPPKSPDNVTDTYDTVVDKLSDPSIFVAFYDWQCYPEYLITFQ